MHSNCHTQVTDTTRSIFSSSGRKQPHLAGNNQGILELFPILFQSDLHELSPRADAELVEKLPERSLHRALGNLQADRDVLVREALKNEAQDGSVPIGELGLS